MIKSRLVSMLRALSTEERSNLVAFISSPYFSERKHLETERMCLLVQLIFEALDSGDKNMPSLERHTLYETLFPGNAFAESTIHNLFNHTKGMLEKFIVQLMLERSIRPTLENTQILRFFMEKGVYKHSDKYLTELQQNNSLNNFPDDLDFLQRWQAEEAIANYLGMKTALQDDYNLLGSLQALEQFYLIKRLETLAILFNQNNLTPILKQSEVQALQDDACSWSSRPEFNIPLVQIYCKVLTFLQENSPQAEAAFDHFWTLMAQHGEHLNFYYQKSLDAFAYNFCARRFSNEKYRNRLFELLRRRIQPSRLSKDGTIQAIELLSILKAGLLAGEIDLMHALLNAYRKKIKGRQPSDVYYKFCQAYLFFYTGKFDEAYAVFPKKNFIDTSYKHFSKILEIKILFSIGADQDTVTESKLLAFRVALTREKKLPKPKLAAFRNFIKITLALVHWRMGTKDPDALRKLYKKTLAHTNLAEETWLKPTIKDLLDKLK